MPPHWRSSVNRQYERAQGQESQRPVPLRAAGGEALGSGAVSGQRLLSAFSPEKLSLSVTLLDG